jgi:hypothetical protein
VRQLRTEFQSALKEASDHEDDTLIVAELNSTIQSLAVDVLAIGPKLEVLSKVYDVAKVEIQEISAHIKGESIEGSTGPPPTPEELKKKINRSIDFFAQLGTGLQKFELQA